MSKAVIGGTAFKMPVQMVRNLDKMVSSYEERVRNQTEIINRMQKERQSFVEIGGEEYEKGLRRGYELWAKTKTSFKAAIEHELKKEI